MSLPPASKARREPLLGGFVMIVILGVLAVAFIYLGVIPWALGWAVRAAMLMMGAH